MVNRLLLLQAHCVAALTIAEPLVATVETNAPAGSSELKGLTLEELMRIEVTTVGRRPQPVADVASAIHVITQDDIRRSGVTSIPEALRLAPGVQVARLDAHDWAVSARGFNDLFANKLLVLQDGRTLYTPLFSGTFWDVQDTALEDIERIEVVRGPGATLWGANAVNGVINIITKHTKDTQGVLASGGAGTEERGFGTVRYGGKISDDVHYRVFGKYADHDDSVLPNGDEAHDSWQMGRGGFRMDWGPSDVNDFLLLGEWYAGRALQVYTVPTLTGPVGAPDDNHMRGGYVLGRWAHNISAESDFRMQVYYDRNERDTLVFKEQRDTADLDIQQHFPIGTRNDVMWGAGYRISHDDIPATQLLKFSPKERTINLFSSFVQDEITLVADCLRLAIGTKFEHNDFTGFEVQPSGRIVWTPTEDQSMWAAISRAVRTPSRAEADVTLFQPLPTGQTATLLGSDRFESEKLIGYEVGYRVQIHSRVSFDLAAYYNDYDDLRTIEPIGPLTFAARNRLEGETYGTEIAPRVKLADWWQMSGGYTYLQIQLHRRSNSADLLAETDEGKSPHHQFFVRSAMDFPRHVELDATIRYVDSLPALHVPSYLVLDTRLGWRPCSHLELALVGQNLLDAQHQEFARSLIQTQITEVEHSIYGKITWRF